MQIQTIATIYMGMRSKQLALVTKTWAKDRFAFGGSLQGRSNPKIKRRFVKGLPSHIILKSSGARGAFSLLRFNKEISRLLQTHAQTHGIEVMSVANAGNHLHILVKAPSREHQSNFLRAVSGHIARMVKLRAGALILLCKVPHKNSASTPALNRSSSTLNQKFWDARPFSRVVSLGRDLKNVLRYLTVNSTEMTGLNRVSVKFMFEKIQSAIKAGDIPINRSLLAAGFG